MFRRMWIKRGKVIQNKVGAKVVAFLSGEGETLDVGRDGFVFFDAEDLV